MNETEIKVVKHVKESFSQDVESFVTKSENAITILEAIIEVAERKGIELDVVPRLLTAKLKEMLEAEMEQRKMLKKDPEKETLEDFE